MSNASFYFDFGLHLEVIESKGLADFQPDQSCSCGRSRTESNKKPVVATLSRSCMATLWRLLSCRANAGGLRQAWQTPQWTVHVLGFHGASHRLHVNNQQASGLASAPMVVTILHV